MTLLVSNADIQAFKPATTGSSPDFTVPQDDIESASMTHRLQRRKDTGSFDLNNDTGQYGDNGNPIKSGYRLEFRVTTESDTSLTRRWTAIAKSPTFERLGGGLGRVDIPAVDYVFWMLDHRTVENAFTDTQISGTSSSVLETILSNNASEVDQSKISTITDTADFFWDSKSLMTAVGEIADRADAVIGADDQSLTFDRLGTLSPEWTLTGSDFGTLTAPRTDDSLVNTVRVDGGTDTAIDDEQTTQSSTTTVTDSSRIQHQLSTRKSELDKIEVWTSPSGSGEDVIVRLQVDDGGSPKAPGDRESDIARKTLDSAFLASSDYTTFLIPDHDLPEPNPWMLIESSGSTGQDIGVDGSDNPTYKAHFPFPISIRVEDDESQNNFRERQERIRQDNLTTREAARSVGEDHLFHNNEPEQTIEFDAVSQRAHDLSTGDVITVNEPDDRAVGEFVVTGIAESFDGVRLDTTITAQQTASL